MKDFRSPEFQSKDGFLCPPPETPGYLSSRGQFPKPHRLSLFSLFSHLETHLGTPRVPLLQLNTMI